MSSARVVCLLPARNAERDLPGYLAAVERVCDAVVALDDGSTDATGELLAACPLVARLLRNPPRASYHGWDDAANRNRLLAAAGELRPDWILQLDADERLDPGDAAALRDFLATDRPAGHAYGFRRFAMHRDLEHHWPRALWVYRLFRWEPGQRLPDRRLHGVPVPASIPPSRWCRTTLRIQHLASLDGERRRARFAKFEQADPEHDFQADYRGLLMEPSGPSLRWQPRPPGLPVLPAPEAPAPTEPRPALSAIVIARDDQDRIVRTLGSVVGQEVPEPFEVIVVVSGTDRTAQIVRERFPAVKLVELPRPAWPGAARNAGLRLARGEFVSFPGSHVALLPGSLAARLRAHRQGYDLVTGATYNGNCTAAGWASYFLDHAANLPTQRPNVLPGVPPHCSYPRALLEELGGFPEDRRAGEDLAVNAALVAAGRVAYRDPAIRFIHGSPCRTPGRLLIHHFERGRGLGRLLVEAGRAGHRLDPALERAGRPDQPLRRLRQIDDEVYGPRGAYRAVYRRVRPLVGLGLAATQAGVWCELLLARLRRRARSAPAPPGGDAGPCRPR